MCDLPRGNTSLFEYFVKCDEYGSIRDPFVEMNGWAHLGLVTLSRLADIIGEKTVLSIGSGKAYIESMLRMRHDIDVIATDIGIQSKPFMKVDTMSATDAVRIFKDSEVLLSIWPTYVSSYASWKYVDPSECYYCSGEAKSFQLKRCTNKPVGYKKMSPEAKKEFQRAQIRRQVNVHRKGPSDRQLCVCCANPEHNSVDFAYESLKLFKGNTFIHIGEGPGGCTGSDRMWCELQKNWTLTHSIDHPNWRKIYSYIQVYERKLI